MDPVTQGAIGAAAAQLGVGHKLGKQTWLYGVAGGMAADLDVLIRSSTDPLLAIEFHRHFTHSLVFIPIGGAIAALPWFWRQRHRAKRWTILAATTLGYATHALLDSCTTYGTQLLWPFSSQRVSFGFISIVDLLFTLPLLLGVVLAARRASQPEVSRRIIGATWAWCLAYLALGAWQHHRADSVQQQLAQHRQHTPERGAVFVSIANQMTWRSVYENDGRLYVDKIRVPYLGEAVVTPGDNAPLPPEDLASRMNEDPATERGLKLITWFSGGWILAPADDPGMIIDARYGHGPTSLVPMWGVRLQPGAAHPVEWVDNTSGRDVSWGTVGEMIFGDGPNAIRASELVERP